MRIQSGPRHAAKGGVPLPPTIMAIASALSSLLTATAAPAVPWLSLNVTIVDNDRGASPSSYRARVLGAGAQEVPSVTAWVHARWQPLPGTCCSATARHDDDGHDDDDDRAAAVPPRKKKQRRAKGCKPRLTHDGRNARRASGGPK